MGTVRRDICGCRLLPAAALFLTALAAPAASQSATPDFSPSPPGRSEAPAPEPVPIIRFRCVVPPGSAACSQDPASGEPEACDCAQDFRYKDAAGARICEKS